MDKILLITHTLLRVAALSDSSMLGKKGVLHIGSSIWKAIFSKFFID